MTHFRILVITPINVIQIDMEIQEEYLQILCFEFYEIGAPSRSKSAHKRTKVFWNAEYGILDRFDIFCILAITLSSELRLRLFKFMWETKRNTYNFYVLSFTRFGLLHGQNWPATGQNFLDQKQNTVWTPWLVFKTS